MSKEDTVLIVDDESSSRQTLEALLYAEGYRLSFATNGQQAITRLEAESVDIILSDVMMPGMDGFELCRRTKAHPEWSLIPLILITALDGNEDLVRGLEAGADEFLHKPVERRVLKARIGAMLRTRARYERLRVAPFDLDTLLRSRRDRIADDAELSHREREVLDLLLLGRNHQEIGAALGISPRTSRFHQTNVLEKLGADSRIDLLRLFL
ncbi:MAG: response regulator [Nannocystaceae bacterium]